MGTTTNILMRRTPPGAISHRQVSALAARLRQLADVCTVVVIMAVPLASATIQESGNLLFVSAGLVMGVSWAMAQVLDLSRGHPPYCRPSS